MEWQPIETAPEAFIDVLLWDGGEDLGVGFLTEEGDWILKCRVNWLPTKAPLKPCSRITGCTCPNPQRRTSDESKEQAATRKPLQSPGGGFY